MNRNLQKSESFGRKMSKNSADQDWIQMAGPKPFDTMHSCIVLQSLQYHPNVVSLSFRCRFIPRDNPNFFAVERPKNDNISRCRDVSFQNEEERHKVLVRGNDRNAVGTTHSVWGRSTERLRRKAERWVTSGPSGPRSCRSDLVPRSRVVPNHPRTI